MNQIEYGVHVCSLSNYDCKFGTSLSFDPVDLDYLQIVCFPWQYTVIWCAFVLELTALLFTTNLSLAVLFFSANQRKISDFFKRYKSASLFKIAFAPYRDKGHFFVQSRVSAGAALYNSCIKINVFPSGLLTRK